MKPELEDLLLHYGVRGMKWRDVKDKVEEAKDTASEVDSILRKGDFTGKGPWEEDEKMVDRLFDLREGFLKKTKSAKKKAVNLEKALKKYGNKTLNSLFPPAKKTRTITTSVTTIKSPSDRQIKTVTDYVANKYKNKR